MPSIKAFNVPLEQLALIERIITRVVPMAERARVEHDRDYWATLLARCCREYDLDLEALYTAPDREFAVDVFGIRNYVHLPSGRFLTAWRPSCIKEGQNA